jgi:hypothetical protein
MLNNLLAMAKADTESVAMNLNYRHAAQSKDLKKQVASLQASVRTLKVEKEVERIGRLDLMDRLQKIQGDFLAKSNQVNEMQEQFIAMKEAKANLETVNTHQVNAIEELGMIVKAKEKEAEMCREQLQQVGVLRYFVFPVHKLG